MAKRRPNPRHIKIHRCYTVPELADLLAIHKNTVRAWIKVGLPTIDYKRPTLIRGCNAFSFLQARRSKNRKTCKPGELYCVRCRAPRLPAGDMVDYLPVTDKIGNLTGICPECESMIHRRISTARLDQVRGKMDIRFPQVSEHLNENSLPSVNSDLK